MNLQSVQNIFCKMEAILFRPHEEYIIKVRQLSHKQEQFPLSSMWILNENIAIFIDEKWVSTK